VRIAFLAFLCSLVPGIAVEDPTALADHYNILVGTLDPTGPSTAQYDAFRYLIKQGPKGWDLLVEAQFETGFLGDAARRIDSYWETSDIPADLLVGYERAQHAELTKRITNETWALLYAGACERVAFHARGDTYFIQLNRLFESIRKHLNQPTEALIDVAFVRVMLVSTPSFPGHRFPWTASAEKQKQALDQLISWWREHQNEHKSKDA
jgi:hypothetical protein